MESKNRKIKIVADKWIPFLKGVMDEYAYIDYLEGSKISREDVMDADALIIRTRTNCNEALLKGTSIKFIATATIGLDHIDLKYCSDNGIEVSSAAGCNAAAVMNYVYSAIYSVASRRAISLEDKTIGIIGLGNVGQKIEQAAIRLGFRVLSCDPPRAAREGDSAFCSLDYLLAHSDIVTIHTPLNDSTLAMADRSFFDKMLPGSFFLNTARGEIVVEQELIAARSKLGAVIIDTWNKEPNINPQFLEVVDIATPHIAGYSYRGKQNGTAMAVRALARHFGLEPLYDFFPREEASLQEATFPGQSLRDKQSFQDKHLQDKALTTTANRLVLSDKNQEERTALLAAHYPIFTDDRLLRENINNFEQLRSNYNYRKEFCIY